MSAVGSTQKRMREPGDRKGSPLRSILHIRRSIYAVMLTLLGGLALQLILPTVAFAVPARITTSSPPPKDLAFARAEVSVVRLVVSYMTTSPRAASSSLAPSPSSTAASKGR